MTVLAADSFHRTNENPMAGDWGAIAGQTYFELLSFEAIPHDAFAENGAVWLNGDWPDDQYSEVKISQLTGGVDTSGIGCCVRSKTDGATQTLYRGYACKVATNNTCITKVVGGTFTLLAQATAAWVVGDTLRLTVQGTTLTVSRNGVAVLTVTDAAVTAGNPGLAYSSTVTTSAVDSWQGGDLGDPSLPKSTGLIGSAGGVS
jgi:hypothetical protein